MTGNEKLIEDALTAFADRDIPAPSREHLSIALKAFEASLMLCGCEACTTSRRERAGITDHDRTALARALHQIVYSPGANYDRAVPGIQEHMLACADKVAAALPWIVPTPGAHTPTDNEREDAHAKHCGCTLPRCEFIEGWELAWDSAYRSVLRRSEVPEPSTEGYAEFEDWEQEMFRHQPVLSMADGSIAGCQCLDRVFVKGREDWGTHLASVITARLPEPQGEPSDAQAEAAISAHRDFPGDYIDRSSTDWNRDRMRAALRAASSVTEQGENR